MSIRTSIILVVFLAMVAGYVFFVQIRQTEEVKEDPPWFFSVDLSDMSRITMKDQGTEVVFFLGDDDHWHLGDPDGLPVGQDKWGGIVLLLGGPKSRRLLDEQPTDLKPYGLDTPQASIEVALKDGRTIHVLMGSSTPDGVATYSQVLGFPQVFTISSEWGQVLLALVTNPPYPEWYYDIDPAQLVNISVRSQEDGFDLTKGEEGWSFVGEDLGPVDQAKLPALLASLEQPSQTLVEYEVEDRAQYGLDEVSVFLLLFLRVERPNEEGDMVISNYRFRIGSPTEDGTGYYVQVERGAILLPDVIKVNADWVEGLQAIVDNPPYLDDTAQGS